MTLQNVTRNQSLILSAIGRSVLNGVFGRTLARSVPFTQPWSSVLMTDSIGGRPLTTGFGVEWSVRHSVNQSGSIARLASLDDWARAGDRIPSVLKTDGGVPEEEDTDFQRYVTSPLPYGIDYPVDWSAEPESSGGVVFDPPEDHSESVVVFVEDATDVTQETYVERFLGTLTADENVVGLDELGRTDVTLPSGETATVIDYAYVGATRSERWQEKYLLVVAGDTGYTVGVDWPPEAGFDPVATRIVESFALDEPSEDGEQQ